MALLFMDSFDHYATADITEKWTASTGTFAIGAYGRNSTNGLRIPSDTSPASVQTSVLGSVALGPHRTRHQGECAPGVWVCALPRLRFGHHMGVRTLDQRGWDGAAVCGDLDVGRAR